MRSSKLVSLCVLGTSRALNTHRPFLVTGSCVSGNFNEPFFESLAAAVLVSTNLYIQFDNKYSRPIYPRKPESELLIST
jgi:hypothetical protein